MRAPPSPSGLPVSASLMLPSSGALSNAKGLVGSLSGRSISIVVHRVPTLMFGEASVSLLRNFRKFKKVLNF